MRYLLYTLYIRYRKILIKILKLPICFWTSGVRTHPGQIAFGRFHKFVIFGLYKKGENFNGEHTSEMYKILFLFFVAILGNPARTGHTILRTGPTEWIHLSYITCIGAFWRYFFAQIILHQFFHQKFFTPKFFSFLH